MEVPVVKITIKNITENNFNKIVDYINEKSH